jgi:hypothetical protein
MPSHELNRLLEELDLQFPAVTSTRIGLETEQAAQSFLSPLVPLLTAVSLQSDRGSIGIGLASCKNIGFALSVAYSIEQIQRTAEDRELELQTRPMEPGQLVRVAPRNSVYKYLGDADFRGEKRLRLMNPTSEQVHLVPFKAALLLTETDSPTPRPRKREAPGSYEETPLDQILGVMTGGNLGGVGIQVIFVTEVEYTVGLAERTRLGNGTTGGNMAELLTWGRIRRDGTLYSEGSRSSEVPTIAVTRSVEVARQALRRLDAGPTRPLVILDAKKAAGHLGGLSEMGKKTRVIVLGEVRDAESLTKISSSVDRTLIFPFSISASTESRPVSTLFSEAADSASALASRKLHFETVREPSIEALADEIRRISRAVRETEDPQLKGILNFLYRALDLARSWAVVATESQRGRLIEIVIQAESDFKRFRHFFSESAEREVGSALNTIESIIFDLVGPGGAKGSGITACLTTGSADLLMVRGHDSASVARAIYAEDGVEVRTDIPPGFTTIVITSAPPAYRLPRIFGTPGPESLTFVGFPFELAWVHRGVRAWREFVERFRASSEVLERVTGISGWADVPGVDEGTPDFGSILPDWSPSEKLEPPSFDEPPQLLMEEDETHRPGVFFGLGFDYCAFLSERTRIPTVFSAEAGKWSVALRPPRKIEPGSRIFLQAARDSEAIAAIARFSLGATTYDSLKVAAREWRVALYRIALDPEIARHVLIEVGVERTLQTVRSWYYDEELIGPARFSDLETVFTFSDLDGSASARESWGAIVQLRNAHRAAGHRLKDLVSSSLSEESIGVFETETPQEVRFGLSEEVEVTGLLLRVETKADAPELYPSRLLNRALRRDSLGNRT